MYFMFFILRSNENIYLIAVFTVCFSTQTLLKLIYQSHRDRKFSVLCCWKPLSFDIRPQSQNCFHFAIILKFVEANIVL